MKIRKYSSPFSYMVIDLDSVFYFINNNFTDYLTKYTYIKNNKYYWCENIWGQNLYFHNLFLPRLHLFK
jgi:hypothetical protein